ncbi:MAG: hypothetical protein AAF430_24880 [Myxococcota bacterium]
MKWALLVLAIAILGAAAWQHARYLGVRRDAAQDLQPLVYGDDAFHLIVYLRTEDDSDAAVLDALRRLKAQTEAALTWVYAGRVAANGGYSRQLGDIRWTACLLLQAPSRAKADDALAGPLGKALASFADVHVHGFDRPGVQNLLFPQLLGLRRLAALARREPSAFPFVRREGDLTMPEAREIGQRMLRGERLSRDAAVVFNLSNPGTPEQQQADAAYVGRMLGSMAEGGYGPIHMGRAVRVTGDAEFENVAIVFYPGVQFFGDMIQSEFFQGIIGGKQLGDNQSTITVPVLGRL